MDRCIKGGGYTVGLPGRGPSDQRVRMLIIMAPGKAAQVDRPKVPA